jgi:matrixin
MIPGLQLPPKEVPITHNSWLGSLRPNATSVRPAVELDMKVEAPPSPESRVQRWHLALASVLVFTAVAGAAVWTSHSHVKHKAVEKVASGSAGLRKTSSGADELWSSPALTITIDPTLANATPAAKDAIMNAFGAWASSDASLPQVSFNATSTPGEAVQDGVNRLLLGPITVPGQEEDLAITISYADTNTGEIIEADTIFNNAYDWASIGSAAGETTACNNRYDLQNVATHEAGHFFGLGEDYTDESTTMFVSSKPCQLSKRTLSKSDVTVMTGLYAQAAANASQKAACGARIAGGRDTNGAALMAMGFVAFALVRRHRRS